MSATRRFMNIETVSVFGYGTTSMPGLSGVGPPPGFMISHEFDSLTMLGFSSRTTCPPSTLE
jgi:hypothetical protein